MSSLSFFRSLSAFCRSSPNRFSASWRFSPWSPTILRCSSASLTAAWAFAASFAASSLSFDNSVLARPLASAAAFSLRARSSADSAFNIFTSRSACSARSLSFDTSDWRLVPTCPWNACVHSSRWSGESLTIAQIFFNSSSALFFAASACVSCLRWYLLAMASSAVALINAAYSFLHCLTGLWGPLRSPFFMIQVLFASAMTKPSLKTSSNSSRSTPLFAVGLQSQVPVKTRVAML
mmetsp:Transcript_105256/g.280224  ORF Transcript_105256/g.280224 Transcript_105256/m.280224 type:complete len:236 (+) Transcript_105256:1690-2397(+)